MWPEAGWARLESSPWTQSRGKLPSSTARTSLVRRETL